jgi:TolA-binding protein
MRSSHLTALGFVWLALASSGCLMLASDGDELREQAKARDRRIEQLESQSKKNQEEIEAKLRELQGVLDRATQVLTRGSADVGAQVEQLREQNAKLEGQVDELKHKLEMVDQQASAARADLDQQIAKLRAGGKETLDPTQIPSDRTAHFQAATASYQAGDYEKARGLWREYLIRYPEDAKAGEAQYWIGASYTQQNKPATALGEYRKVIADFGKSGAINVALYGMADAFYRLHACTDAKSALDALLKRKPEPGLTDRAKKLQKQVVTSPKGYCTS